jgi:protocatechuate 3,4-dioxygenase beta subunit
MKPKLILPPATAFGSRRNFIQRLGLGAALFTVPGAFAEELTHATLTKTPWVEEGPFYPPKLPLDTDNDLIIVNDSITPAKGDPVRNATVEIWSVDHDGVYLAERGDAAKGDKHFQGFGRFLTGSTGEYYFRTLKPVVYRGRQAPHIHFKIKTKGREPWTTQLFVKGHPGNIRDGVYQGISSAARELVTKDFVPVKNSRLGELAAQFDIVLGVTPAEAEH